MSLDELASRSQVSKSMISQIEGSKTNPTITMIWKIARGLGTSLQDLIETPEENLEAREDESPPRSENLFSHTKRENFQQLSADRPGINFRVLTPMDRSGDLEIYRIRIRPGARLDSQAHSPGTEEYLTLYTGELEVRSGEQYSRLKPGDFIMYHADAPHSMINLGDIEADIHLVVRFQNET